MQLPRRTARGGGQGGGGALTSEELYSFILGRCGPPLLLPGTVVHTDGAKAYRDLPWEASLCSEEQPPSDVVERLLAERPCAWRMERYWEVLQRESAERRAVCTGGRGVMWASCYAHLRLAHTAVCHSKGKGLWRNRQFIAMRRVVLAPDIAAILEAKGVDPFLCGCTTWRKGGTQTVDGYWRTMRRHGSHRGINTKFHEVLHQAILVHQWSHWATPAAPLLEMFGEELKQLRVRKVQDMSIAEAAWETCEQELGDDMWQARCHQAAIARGDRWQREEATMAASAHRRKMQARLAAASPAKKKRRLARHGAEPVCIIDSDECVSVGSGSDAGAAGSPRS